ncbi:hypothetical protein B0T17DRAFT_1739 [Bombardia bombarda]|uniref:Rhodopsin domain-containing protein n=1 Tax=Bombardia bombarda TaxID=252184 RepID=A0AA39XII0_9PEZI|nr:hypothetical protein B0T17DRAFT_1739 [Bombardia bombarda]
MALPPTIVGINVVIFITTIFAVTALGLRLWSNRIRRAPLIFSDYMAIVATIFAAGTAGVCLTLGFAAGLGVHLPELIKTSPDKLVLHIKLFIPAQLLWAAANTCVKLSILSLYTTLFPAKPFRRVCYGTMAVSTAYFVTVLLEIFLRCKPVQFSWDKSIVDGTCDGQNTAFLVAGITNLVIDSFIVVLPMPMLWRLQIAKRKKIVIAGMFSLGAVICLLSLLRVIWLVSWDLNDQTYSGVPGVIYSTLEPVLGVVNACLPTIRPALNRLFGHHHSSLESPACMQRT